MKKINKSIQAAGAAAVIILAAGCAAETITAEYVMPPKAVSDIKSIDTMELIAKVNVSDNAAENSDRSYVVGALNQRVSARFCQEGFFRTTDFVWGNPDGAAKMAKVILTNGNMHGYARHVTDPVAKRAKLYLVLSANVKTGKAVKNETFVLKDVPFTRTKAGKVPVGKPDLSRAKIQKAVVPVEIFTISANGNLAVKLVNKEGKVVYTKDFKNLQASHETSMLKRAALPTKSAVVMEMLVPAIETIIADLLPHKEKRALVINEDGDKKACLLLKAQAFTEAISFLDEIEKKSCADYENLGLAYEIIGDYNSAKASFDSALKLKSGSKIAEEGIQRVNEILSAKDTLRNMDAKKTDTQYKKSEFK